MKRLYNESNDRHTEKASEIESKVIPIINDIFMQYFAVEGYSARDISHIINGVVLESEMIAILSLREEKSETL